MQRGWPILPSARAIEPLGHRHVFLQLRLHDLGTGLPRRGDRYPDREIVARLAPQLVQGDNRGLAGCRNPFSVWSPAGGGATSQLVVEL